MQIEYAHRLHLISDQRLEKQALCGERFFKQKRILYISWGRMFRALGPTFSLKNTVFRTSAKLRAVGSRVLLLVFDYFKQVSMLALSRLQGAGWTLSAISGG